AERADEREVAAHDLALEVGARAADGQRADQRGRHDGGEGEDPEDARAEGALHGAGSEGGAAVPVPAAVPAPAAVPVPVLVSLSLFVSVSLSVFAAASAVAFAGSCAPASAAGSSPGRALALPGRQRGLSSLAPARCRASSLLHARPTPARASSGVASPSTTASIAGVRSSNSSADTGWRGRGLAARSARRSSVTTR